MSRCSASGFGTIDAQCAGMVRPRCLTLSLAIVSCACTGTPDDLPEVVAAPADTIARLAATDPRIARVEQLELVAHQAHLAHDAARVLGRPEHTRTAHLRAENDLNVELLRAWAAIPTMEANMSYLVDGPLQLALLDYHIELRRFLGSSFRTRVNGLDDDAGCAGDLVRDRLAWRYGVAAQSGAPRPGDRHPTVDPLHRWAVQVVCLGDAQLARLDYAMDVAFENVMARLRHRGLERLEPALLRTIAPLEVLVLDARKHRGDYSRAWHWFARHRSVLTDVTSAAGWVAGDVMLWNRRQGVLVGFGPCRTGSAPGTCVDLPTLFDSIADPRALGLGQCGLAAMISGGTQALPATVDSVSSSYNLAKGLRYTCPMTACRPTAGGGAVATPELTTVGQRQRLAEVWPALSRASTDVAGALCGVRSGDPQGMSFSVQSCVESEFDALVDGQNTPFETALGCTLAALGPIPGLDLGTDLALSGVPMGTQTSCGELGQGEAGTRIPPIGSQPRPNATRNVTERDAEGRATAVTYVFTASDGTTYVINTGAVTAVGVPRLPTPDNPATTQKLPVIAGASSTESKMGAFWLVEYLKVRVRLERPEDAESAALLVGIASDEPLSVEWVVASKAGVFNYGGSAPSEGEPGTGPTPSQDDEEAEEEVDMDDLPDPEEFVNGEPIGPDSDGQGCFDLGACRDDCTALGRLLTDVDACTEGMVDAMAQALGRPRADITRGRDRVSFPRPPGLEGEAADVGSCYGSTAATEPSVCGLLVCSDGYASPSPGSCTCRGPGGGTLSSVSVCRRMRCADGVLPDPASCACPTPAGTPLPGGSPAPPRPEDWPLSFRPSGLDACAVAAPGVYNYASDPRTIASRDGRALWSR